VPQQLLDDISTTKSMLQDLLHERTIALGITDSEHSLRTRLRRFNASSKAVWGARMQFAADFVRGQAYTRAPSSLPGRHAPPP